MQSSGVFAMEEFGMSMGYSPDAIVIVLSSAHACLALKGVR